MQAEKPIQKIMTCSHRPFLTMSTEVYSAPMNLKFKITTKGIRSDSQEKLNVPVKPSMPTKSIKRKPEATLDCGSVKRQNMDRMLKNHCGNILKDLLSHHDSYIFKDPVDPVKLSIPDYFSIITKPMDLGTVKHKLDSNMYFSADEFAADVKLTFSNAMTYNPAWHVVHKLAKEMNGKFCRRWKLLEAKFQKGNDGEKGISVHHFENNGPMTKQALENSHQDLKPVGLDKKSVHSSHEDKNLRKVGTEVDDMDATCGKVKPARIALKVCSSLRTVQKERITCAPAKQNQSVDSAHAKCPSCDSLTCHCRLKNGSAQASISDISSERSSDNNQSGDFTLGSEAKGPFRRSSFSQDFDGFGVVMHEENSPHISAPATTATSVEDWGSLNVEMSPSKALRVAMLKNRFADTIFRATHQVVKSDHPLTMQQEKQRLEREKREEKSRIEAEIKAAEAASRKKLDDLKIRRERERASARVALEKIEKSVDICETMDIMKDVESLCFGFQRGRALEQLGLYMKDDYLEEDEDSVLSAEEGEIMS